jgi:Bifunctional DNA primase/polymerase, N-terminal
VALMHNPILLAALDYLHRGWSVLPVRGKQPLERWQRWQFEHMTEGQAAQAFSHPEVTGVAIVCGQISGLAVLDFDGAAGRDAFLELYGKGLIELERPTVTTGSGGKHVYYALEPNAKTFVWHHRGARAGEYRAEGGYVLAPPSRHPNGTLYHWDVEALAPLEVMPKALQTALTPTAPIAAPCPAPIVAGHRVPVRVLIAKALHEAVNSGRNNAGFKLATWLRDNSYSIEEAKTVLLEFVAQFPRVATGHAYTSTEALASVRSAYSRAPRAPWGFGGVRA